MKKILIIEDDKNLLHSLVDVLRCEGYEVFAASGGQEGLNILCDESPDLIICDVMMPGKDGYEVLQEITKNEILATIPFIFLTARTQRTDQRRAMEMGADDFLMKPFSVEELLTTIETRLKKSEKVKQVTADKIQTITKSISLSLPHELNTPLSGMIGFSEVLLNEAQFLSTSEIKQMAGFINESSLRLKKTIGKYLNYAKLQLLINDHNERKLLKFHASRISGNLIKNYLNKERIEGLIGEDLTIDIEEAEICVNEEYLGLLLSELIENAIKFSRLKSKILVKGKKGAKNYWLTIYDRGRGMNHRQLSEIGAFVQFNRDHFEQQGSGLGLAIVNNIVSLFDGSIRFSSEIGIGTTVTIDFKLQIE
jgi:signal transduction histidine kinase